MQVTFQVGSKVVKKLCKTESATKDLPPEIWTHWSAELQPESTDAFIAQQIDLILESSSGISWSLASFAGKQSLSECESWPFSVPASVAWQYKLSSIFSHVVIKQWMLISLLILWQRLLLEWSCSGVLILGRDYVQIESPDCHTEAAFCPKQSVWILWFRHWMQVLRSLVAEVKERQKSEPC